MIISDTERVILLNQYKILEKLDSDNKEEYQNLQEVLENGYELEYRYKFSYILDSKMSESDCEFVQNILYLYDMLNNSYEQLEDKTDIDLKDLKFKGFDGNNESQYMGYLKYLVEVDGKYTYLFDKDKKKRYYNTHCQVIPRYESMLERFEDIKTSKGSNFFPFTKEEIISIID